MPMINPGPSLPKSVYLETSNRCNLRCRSCIQYRGRWETERDLSLAELIMITAQLPELERAVLHGIGEPLLNQALPAMIRHLKSHEVFVLFNSNGILLDEQWQAELIEAGLDELRISLDASSAEGYRKMRRSDSFDRIVTNLRQFSERMKNCRAGRPRVSLWFVGTRDNIAELPGLIQLAADIGVPEVYLQRLVYFQDDAGYGAAKAEMTLMDSSAATGELIAKSQDAARRLGVKLSASGRTTPSSSLRGKPASYASWRKCSRPGTLTYITAHGNVLPCCIAPFATKDYPAIILGNVFSESLAKIWYGRQYRHFRQQRQTDTPPQCCLGCGFYWSL